MLNAPGIGIASCIASAKIIYAVTRITMLLLVTIFVPLRIAIDITSCVLHSYRGSNTSMFFQRCTILMRSHIRSREGNFECNLWDTRPVTIHPTVFTQPYFIESRPELSRQPQFSVLMWTLLRCCNHPQKCSLPWPVTKLQMIVIGRYQSTVFIRYTP